MSVILAVSGGIDSVAMLSKFCAQPDVRVAHFDHGTRPSSRDDQVFVARLAKQYNLPYNFYESHLGTDVSEAEARAARYKFLIQLAKKYNGVIYTAHHLDDLVETVAINCIRGTGWRGLAVFSSPWTKQPFLDPAILPGAPWSKTDIYQYAADHQLIFRDDPTNTEPKYLRNTIRPLVSALPYTTKEQIYRLWHKQTALRSEIETLSRQLVQQFANQRAFYQSTPDEVALVCLQTWLAEQQIEVTRPQLQDCLEAIRTYQNNKYFNLPHDRLLHITKHTFTL